MKERIGIVGLGYVGLPLAAAFADVFDVVGYDVDTDRVAQLRAGNDHTMEVEDGDLCNERLTFTTELKDLSDCTFLIVTVPTPINRSKVPDLSYVESASEQVGSILKKGMAVVYESTVYPGVTEELCLPILEQWSGLKLGDFDLGYSPERVNPGDREHTVRTIQKVVSGHSDEALARIASVYEAVVDAGVHRAPNIKTAEAAKVIENVQRDLNIALMNELSKIFGHLGIQTRDVIEAAGTKWNFHKYFPGLVGGHCIGVDPYYLTYKALELGYNPEVILAGRRINDSMGEHVAELAVEHLVRSEVLPQKSKVWVWGLTFKENVPDFRNSKAHDVIRILLKHNVNVAVWEPMVTDDAIRRDFGYEVMPFDRAEDVDALIVINAHREFRSIGLEDLLPKMRHRVLLDVKGMYDRAEAEQLGFHYATL